VKIEEGEPGSWLVLFAVSTGRPWLDRIIPGKFKHVSAAAWITDTRTWVFYDVTLWRTSVNVLPMEAGDRLFALATRTHSVLRVPAGEGRVLLRIGFWCVPAIKHLLGSSSGALLPSRLWRDLVATGAEIVHVFSEDPAERADQGRIAGVGDRA
jgi:hypothetical protein